VPNSVKTIAHIAATFAKPNKYQQGRLGLVRHYCRNSGSNNTKYSLFGDISPGRRLPTLVKNAVLAQKCVFF